MEGLPLLPALVGPQGVDGFVRTEAAPCPLASDRKVWARELIRPPGLGHSREPV